MKTIVTKENLAIVATNTRVLGAAKHYVVEIVGQDSAPFLVHKSIVDLALKQTKALYFELSSGQIKCLDKDHEEIITISKRDVSMDMFKYPPYKSIIPTDMKEKIPFTQSSQIDGILALNKIQINPKFIPKINVKGDGDFLGGYVGIESRERPIKISEKNGSFVVVIMPIIDRLSIFNEGN